MKKNLPKFFIATCIGIFLFFSPVLAQLDFPTADPTLDPRQDLVDQAYVENAEKLTIPALQEKINNLPPDSPERKALEDQLARTQTGVANTKLDLKSRQGPSECGWFSGFGCFFEKVFGVVGEFLMLIAGGILWVAGLLFDLALSESVVHLKTYVDSPGLTAAWSALRDFANLFFIFILLYVAAAFILDLKVNNKDKIIVTVIISALLINFSAFFARAVIDISNVAAVQLYKPLAEKGKTYEIPVVKWEVGGVAGLFMRELSLTDSVTDPTGSPVDILVRVIGNVVLLLITAFVFLAGAILLIIRAVYLIILIIVSPLAFLAYAVPNWDKYFKDWGHKLFNQAFFAPAYLLFIFASSQVLGSGIIKTISRDGESSKIALIFNFAIIIGLMIGSLIAAVKLSAFGANTVVGYGKKMKDWGIGTAKGAGLGSLGILGTNTLGRLATKASNSEWAKRQVANRTWLGGGLKNIADTTSKYGFGRKEGFKQKVENLAKIPAELKDRPDLQAKYLAGLNRPLRNIPFLKKIPLPSLSGGELSQAKAYKNLSMENKTKISLAIEQAEAKVKQNIIEKKLGIKATDVSTSRQEKLTFEEASRDLLDWAQRAESGEIDPRILSLPENVAKMAQAKEAKQKIIDLTEKIKSADKEFAKSWEKISKEGEKELQKENRVGKVVKSLEDNLSPGDKIKLAQARLTLTNKQVQEQLATRLVDRIKEAKAKGNNVEATQLEQELLRTYKKLDAIYKEEDRRKKEAIDEENKKTGDKPAGDKK